MQQDSPHCEAPAIAATLAQQSPHVVSQPHTVRCSCGTRGHLRRRLLHQIRHARVVPEPSRLQEAPRTSRGGVRLRQPRPAGDPLRRVTLRGGDPVHFPIRVRRVGPVRR